MRKFTETGKDKEEPAFASLCLSSEFREYFRFEVCKGSQMVLKYGDKIEYFGIVMEGILKAGRCSYNGNELCGSYFEKGEIFPEFLYFSGRRTLSYDLISVKTTEIAWVPAVIFERMIREDDGLMNAFLFYMSKRGLKNQLLLNCMNYQTIEERIAFWLVEMNNLDQGEAVILPRSQTMFANMLHVSRSSLNQTLKRMERVGCIKTDGHRLVLLDRGHLERML